MISRFFTSVASSKLTKVLDKFAEVTSLAGAIFVFVYQYFGTVRIVFVCVIRKLTTKIVVAGELVYWRLCKHR